MHRIVLECCKLPRNRIRHNEVTCAVIRHGENEEPTVTPLLSLGDFNDAFAVVSSDDPGVVFTLVFRHHQVRLFVELIHVKADLADLLEMLVVFQVVDVWLRTGCRCIEELTCCEYCFEHF